MAFASIIQVLFLQLKFSLKKYINQAVPAINIIQNRVIPAVNKVFLCTFL